MADRPLGSNHVPEVQKPHIIIRRNSTGGAKRWRCARDVQGAEQSRGYPARPSASGARSSPARRETPSFRLSKERGLSSLGDQSARIPTKTTNRSAISRWFRSGRPPLEAWIPGLFIGFRVVAVRR